MSFLLRWQYPAWFAVMILCASLYSPYVYHTVLRGRPTVEWHRRLIFVGFSIWIGFCVLSLLLGIAFLITGI